MNRRNRESTNKRTYFLRILNWLGILAIVFVVSPSLTSVAVAQAENTNPLEQPINDPLLPQSDRPLTPFERRRLQEALDKLNNEAQALFKAGKSDRAFATWYRELRLRSILGRREEIQALGRVGEIAWEENRTEDLQNIIKRLNSIEQQAQTNNPLNREELNAFAIAYQQMRDVNNSIDIYQKILVDAEAKNDKSDRQETLNKLGELYLAKFDYSNAAKIYEVLLKTSQQEANLADEETYLQQLANIYTQLPQHQQAVRIKEQLVIKYQTSKKLQLLPALKLSLAADYEALKEPEKASQNYQEAFSLAWSSQDYGIARDALIRLGNLYQTNDRDDYALQIYQELINVEKQTYDYYGLMNTYDRIGKIYLKQKNYPQAKSAFQQGLELANSLSYQQDYFLTQLEKVEQQLK